MKMRRKMLWSTEMQVKYQFCKVLLDTSNRNVPKYNSYGKKNIYSQNKKKKIC